MLEVSIYKSVIMMKNIVFSVHLYVCRMALDDIRGILVFSREQIFIPVYSSLY